MQEQLMLKYLQTVHVERMSMAIQGDGREFGGTAVVYLDNYEKVGSIPFFIGNLLSGNPTPGTIALANAAEQKIARIYAAYIKLSGRDKDGDALYFEYNLPAPQFLALLRGNTPHIIQPIAPEKTWISRLMEFGK